MPTPTCGDGVVQGLEACDDGNLSNNDACLNDCTVAVCGDGFVRTDIEQCDDGDLDDLNGCHNDCSPHRATALALGGNHTCAVLDSGTIKCWGNSHDGRTGYASEEDFGDDEPVSVLDTVDAGGTVADVVGGVSHTCVLHPGGGVRCFGRNSDGQLGLGNTLALHVNATPAETPLATLGFAAASVNTRGGAFHTCAVSGGGAVKCWGMTGRGRLGVPAYAGQDAGDNEPVSAVPWVNVGGAVTQVAVGREHTCALLSGGTVRCWGSNATGALGHGLGWVDIGDDEDPASIAPVNLGGTAVQITAGWNHTCALLSGGTVRCWGHAGNGRLGYGNPQWVGVFNSPAEAGDVAVGGAVVQIEAGLAHTCARLSSGAVRCWGWGGQGQLGYGNTAAIGDNETPSAAGNVPVGGAVSQIAADGNHTCAIMAANGGVRCWGNGGDGRLGYGNVNWVGDNETPASVGDVPLFD